MDILFMKLAETAGIASPVLVLIWWMLKDVRKSNSLLTTKVSAMELKQAEANYDLKISYLDKSLERTIRGLESRIDSLQNQMAITVSKIDAAWRHIDNSKGGNNG